MEGPFDLEQVPHDLVREFCGIVEIFSCGLGIKEQTLHFDIYDPPLEGNTLLANLLGVPSTVEFDFDIKFRVSPTLNIENQLNSIFRILVNEFFSDELLINNWVGYSPTPNMKMKRMNGYYKVKKYTGSQELFYAFKSRNLIESIDKPEYFKEMLTNRIKTSRGLFP